MTCNITKANYKIIFSSSTSLKIYEKYIDKYIFLLWIYAIMKNLCGSITGSWFKREVENIRVQHNQKWLQIHCQKRDKYVQPYQKIWRNFSSLLNLGLTTVVHQIAVNIHNLIHSWVTRKKKNKKKKQLSNTEVNPHP